MFSKGSVLTFIIGCDVNCIDWFDTTVGLIWLGMLLVNGWEVGP